MKSASGSVKSSQGNILIEDYGLNMVYKYATKLDYTDLSSGRVLYSSPGFTALPVRLADEVFQRCVSFLKTSGKPERLTLYDPCCGGGYHLAVIGILHAHLLKKIIGSDIDEEAVSLARKNISLVSIEGLKIRYNEINKMSLLHGKSTHRDALLSVDRLCELIKYVPENHQIEKDILIADALNTNNMTGNFGHYKVDIVLTDVPYGQLSEWHTVKNNCIDNNDHLNLLLESVSKIIKPDGIVGIISAKKQKPMHDSFKRIEKFNAGKRRVEILRYTV
jgi:23S rRNA (guanine2535-N1)-methyltransferase